MTASRPTLGALLIAALLVLPVGAGAQTCRPATAEEGPTPDRVDELDPGAGQPGATVRVRDRDLPVYATVHLAIGQVGGGGYQVGDPLETSATGELEGTVQVPEWAEPDQPVFVMVFSDQFRPIAFSPPFHVTDPSGLVRRSGTAVTLDGGCPGLEADDVTYALTGPAAAEVAAAAGRTVTVEARPLSEACGCADALEVVRVVEGAGGS